MRHFLLPILLLGLAGGTVQASPQQPLFPRVAAAIHPSDWKPMLAMVGHPEHKWMNIGPQAASITFLAFSLARDAALNAVGMYVPIAIRACRVVVHGSPIDGPKRDTLIWIASPTALRVKSFLRYGTPLLAPPPTMHGRYR